MGGGAEEEPEPAAATTETEEASKNGSSGEGDQPRRRIIQQDKEVEPLDLGEASRDAIIKRAIPVVAGVAVLAVVIWFLRRRS